MKPCLDSLSSLASLAIDSQPYSIPRPIMQTFVLIASPIGSNTKPEWLAVSSDMLAINSAKQALLAVGAVGVEIRIITNGVLGKPVL